MTMTYSLFYASKLLKTHRFTVSQQARCARFKQARCAFSYAYPQWNIV